MKRITKVILTLALLTGSITVSGFEPVHAQSALTAVPSSLTMVADTSKQDACAGLKQVSGTGCGAGQGKIGTVAQGIVAIISVVAGAIAVIMIMVSGIRYMTSGGDSSKVSAAKTALIYALIGLAIVGLTQVLIHFVLSTSASV
jgi:hypothetical protein